MTITELREGSPSATRFLAVLAVVALAVVAAVWPTDGGAWTAALRPEVLLLVVLGAVTLAFPLRFQHGNAVSGFTLAPAVTFSTGLVLADGVVVVLAGLMAAAGFARATRSVVKTVFNTAQTIVAAAAGVGVAGVVVGGPLTGEALAGLTPLAIAVGSAVFGVAQMLLVNEMLHRLAGDPRRLLLREMLAPSAWVVVADIVVALLLGVLVTVSVWAVVLAIPMFAGMQLSYRGFAADREGARRATLLHDTSRRLVTAAVEDRALEDAVGGLRELFHADRATLVLAGDASPAWLGDTVEQVLTRREPIRDGDTDRLVAPVEVEGDVVGVVAVGGRRALGAWTATDLDLLSTVAGEIAATVRTRRLLTQLERERARLAAETSKLTDVLTSASDGIVVLDAQGRLEACNPAMLDLLGDPSGGVLGALWSDVLRLESEDGTPLAEDRDAPLPSALAGRTRVERADAALRRPDGEVRWLRCSAAPVVSAAGVTSGVVLVVVDLTREREVDQLRSDFIATVSHELRTPLTPLGGFLRVMREHGTSLGEDRMDMMVSAMEKQVGRLADLIGDLLHVAEIDRRTLRLQPEVLDLARATTDVVDVEAVAADERARITVDAEPTAVVADPDAVRRVMRALISNGFKHTHGVVHVSVGRDGTRGVVRVADEGPRIPPSSREAVFEPFRRLGDHLHRTQGPGLGLSVARSLVEALDGTLSLHTSEHGGNEFVLTLPAAEGAAGASEGGVAGGTEQDPAAGTQTAVVTGGLRGLRDEGRG